MAIEVAQGTDMNLQFWLAGLNESMLQIAYEAENVSSSDLYVFNRLRVEGNKAEDWVADPDLVYVSIEGDCVHVTKRIADFPEGFRAEHFIIPFATPLPRGERLTETLNLRLPLRAFNPYLGEPPSAPTQTYRAMVFSLGYFRVSEIGSIPVAWMDTPLGRGLYVHVSPFDQLVVRASPIRVTVPVRG